jgi:hypothetical protein
MLLHVRRHLLSIRFTQIELASRIQSYAPGGRATALSLISLHQLSTFLGPHLHCYTTLEPCFRDPIRPLQRAPFQL